MNISNDYAIQRKTGFGFSPELTFAGVTSFARRRYTNEAIVGVDDDRAICFSLERSGTTHYIYCRH
jgi:hypothetical protein